MDRSLGIAYAIRRAAALAFALPACATALADASGDGAASAQPGPETYLVQLGVPNRGMAVFLPSAEISSKEAAAAYLAWARETFPAWSGRMKGVWDAGDEIELQIRAEPPEPYAAFLRKGDAVVDPSGRNVFEVAETPAKQAKTVRVRMVRPFAPGEATPETCITNAWALPRETLFQRWHDELEALGRSNVVRDIEALEGAGRFSASFDDGGAWKEAVKRFVAEEPGMRARFVFTNETGGAILLAFEGVTNRIEAGGKDVRTPKGEVSRRIPWSARGASDPTTSDEDWIWESGEKFWKPDADNVFVRIAGPVGTLKENPALFLSSGQLAGAKEIEATVLYDGGGEGPALAVESVSADRLIRVPAGRRILSVRVSSEGFHPAQFVPRGGPAAFARGMTPISLDGDALRPIPKPWPEKLVVCVDRNGLRGRVWVKVSGFADGKIQREELPEDATEAIFGLGEALGEQSSRETADLVVAVDPVDDNSRSKTVSAFARRGEALATLSVKLDPPRIPTPSASSTASSSRQSVFPKNTGHSSATPPQWPDDDRIHAAMAWISEKRTGQPSGLIKLSETDGPQSKNRRESARRKLTALVSFWPESFWTEEERPHEQTFRDLVAHLAGCDGACGNHGPTENPKSEALRLLGWKARERQKFCDGIRDAPENKWPWKTPDERSDDVVFWWTQIRRDATDPKNPIRKDALALWTGTGDDGKKFKEAYRHSEVCPGCEHCPAYFGFLRPLPTFKARRRELFLRLVLDDSVRWGDYSRPTKKEVGDFMDKLDEWERQASGKSAPAAN